MPTVEQEHNKYLHNNSKDLLCHSKERSFILKQIQVHLDFTTIGLK